MKAYKWILLYQNGSAKMVYGNTLKEAIEQYGCTWDFYGCMRFEYIEGELL